MLAAAAGPDVRTTEATMVQVIDELEKAGAVRRERNPVDRRSNSLVLTTAGRELVGVAVGVRQRVQSEVAQVVGASGDERLRAPLTKLLWGAPPPPGR